MQGFHWIKTYSNDDRCGFPAGTTVGCLYFQSLRSVFNDICGPGYHPACEVCAPTCSRDTCCLPCCCCHCYQTGAGSPYYQLGGDARDSGPNNPGIAHISGQVVIVDFEQGTLAKYGESVTDTVVNECPCSPCIWPAAAQDLPATQYTKWGSAPKFLLMKRI